MRKGINILLGFMVALLSNFGFLHANKQIKVKYGVPPEILEREKERHRAGMEKYEAEQRRLEEEKKAAQDSIQPAENDTTKGGELTFDDPNLPPVPDVPVCKYGPPGGKW